MARLKPIETILSGPAASLVGARWLTGQADALVSDIGGTTTDVAVLRNGKPKIDPLGARVGPYRTMVEAVAMHTTGLGGDSELSMTATGLIGGLHLGPRRLMPIALCAVDWPDTVHAALDRQLASERVGEYDARFVIPLRSPDRTEEGLSSRERAVLAKTGTICCELGAVVTSRMEFSALERLVARGLVMVSGVTPSDAAHVLGRQATWDALAAEKALTLFARHRTGSGDKLALDAKDLAARVIGQLVDQTCETLLTTALNEDDDGWDNQTASDLARHVLMRAGLRHYRGLVALDAALNLPVVGLGASAATYYGAVGERLGTEVILPQHAGVANALGAVVGQVSIRASGTITCPSEGRFRVHLPSGPQDFATETDALDRIEAHLTDDAKSQAHTAGAENIQLSVSRDIRRSDVEGRPVFVEATVQVTASGRPRFAH
jgi:N-methylhydantoinase A/oxoprolinase/acetone carboxylase beta subunit